VSTSDYSAPRLDRPRLPGLRALVRARPISTDVWVLLALIAVAAVIRIVTIDNQSFWQDEALTAYEAQLPFGAMLHTVFHVETTPPLYFVLIWGWAKLFGTSEIALRSISTLAGIALVPIAFLSARELGSRWAGVLAAAFVAVSPYLIWYSQEARAYMLLVALTGAGFLWFARALEQPTRRNLGWWVGCSALALMTHFFAAFVVAPEALLLLWRHRQRAVVIAAGLLAAVEVAMLPFALADTGHGTGWIAAVPLRHRVGDTTLQWLLSNDYRGYAPVTGLLLAGALFVVVTLLVALGRDKRLRQGAVLAGGVSLFAIGAPIVLALLHHDYFLPRNVLPAFIPVVTTVAIACAVPRARVLGGALAVLLIAISSVAAYRVQTKPQLGRPNWRHVAQVLGPAPAPRAIFAADGFTADPLKVYMPGVSWVQPQNRAVVITEIDVVGATKRLALLKPAPSRGKTGRVRLSRMGSPVPALVAPRGTRLIGREKVNNWILARFALDHPERLTIRRLIARAPRFFLRTPKALLIFVQQPRR
jgi:4-amino-4-deoxy-L-arabinose transferase-like glycosyltransferase